MIALIGLPGCGKSTVGRQLARRLNVPFFDSDQVLEQRLGCSVRDYFEREGESCFRDREETVIDELSQVAEGVLSTGVAQCCDLTIASICASAPMWCI